MEVIKSVHIHVENVKKTYGNQSKLEEHMSKCIEQEACNVSNIHLNQKIKFNDWYLKIDPSMWIVADLECKNKPVVDNQVGLDKKLFVNKPVATEFNILKNSVYDN